MTQPEPPARTHSPNAERLRQAMGWDRLPEMTPEERAEFEEENRKATEEARRYWAARQAE